MSKHDPRKGLYVSIPEELRLALVNRSSDWRPLPSLLRGAVVRGLAYDPLPLSVQDGENRPVLLQLSKSERSALEDWATRHDLHPPQAVIALAASAIELGRTGPSTKTEV